MEAGEASQRGAAVTRLTNNEILQKESGHGQEEADSSFIIKAKLLEFAH